MNVDFRLPLNALPPHFRFSKKFTPQNFFQNFKSPLILRRAETMLAIDIMDFSTISIRSIAYLLAIEYLSITSIKYRLYQ